VSGASPGKAASEWLHLQACEWAALAATTSLRPTASSVRARQPVAALVVGLFVMTPSLDGRTAAEQTVNPGDTS